MLQRHHRQQRLAGYHVLPGTHAALADDTVDGRAQNGVLRVLISQRLAGLGTGQAGRALRDLGIGYQRLCLGHQQLGALFT
ncbi:hypothetical protein D3C80_2029720 [compost metagenome]